TPCCAVEAAPCANPESAVAPGVEGAHLIARETLLRGVLFHRIRDPQEPAAVGAQPERPLRFRDRHDREGLGVDPLGNDEMVPFPARHSAVGPYPEAFAPVLVDAAHDVM